MIKNEKVALDRLRVRQNVFLVYYIPLVESASAAHYSKNMTEKCCAYLPAIMLGFTLLYIC